MEESIGMQVVARDLCQLELPLGDVLDELFQLVRAVVERDEHVLNLGEVVALLEDAGGHERHDPLLRTVDLLDSSLIDLPLGLGKLQGRLLDVLLPFLDVFADNLVGSVNREGTRLAVSPRDGDTPVVDLVELARLRIVARTIRGGEDDSESFVLLDEALGLSALHRLDEVLTRSEFPIAHRCSFLSIVSCKPPPAHPVRRGRRLVN